MEQVDNAPSAASSSASGNRETGTVKRFNKEKGYGFISKNSDGSDCFVHFKNISGTGFKSLEEGQQVEFDVVQGDKGIEARDVTVVDGGLGRLPHGRASRDKPSFLSDTDSARSSRFGTSTSSQYNFGGFSNANSKYSPSSAQFDSGDDANSSPFRFGEGSTAPRRSFNFSMGSSNTSNSRAGKADLEMGSVKRWTTERGFGFIRRASGGADLFVHVRSLKNGVQELQEGQTVQFKVQLTERGEEARDVRILTDEDNKAQSDQWQTTADTGSPDRSGTHETGTVKRWSSEKNYGFIRPSSGGSDIFVHISSLQEGLTSLEEGQTVEFDIISSEKGNVARNVTVHTDI